MKLSYRIVSLGLTLAAVSLLVGCTTITKQCKDAINGVTCALSDGPPTFPDREKCEEFKKSVDDRIQCVTLACKTECNENPGLCPAVSAVSLAYFGKTPAKGAELAALEAALDSAIETVDERATSRVSAGNSGEPIVETSSGLENSQELKKECENIKAWKEKCKSVPFYIPMPKPCCDSFPALCANAAPKTVAQSQKTTF